MKMEAEGGVKQLQPKECQGLLQPPEARREARDGLQSLQKKARVRTL